MMKNYKIWLIVVLALLAVNSAVLAMMWLHHKHPPMAREQGMPPQQGGMEPKDVLIKALAFTPKQQTLFDTMRTKHRSTVNQLEDANRKLRDSLFENIKKPKADTVAINAIARKISDNQSAIEKTTLYHFRELRGILTPGQQTKFDSVIQQVLQMMGNPAPGRRPPGGNGNPPPQDKMHAQQGPPPSDRPARGDRPRGERMGPPPNGMPPPQDVRRRDHRLPPPTGRRPPGPDGMPPDGPPPPNGGPPPNGPPPNGGPPPDGHPPL